MFSDRPLSSPAVSYVAQSLSGTAIRPVVVLVLLTFSALACNLSLNPDVAASGKSRPALVFLAPDNSSTVAEGATIQLAVSVRDPGGAGVARVDFKLDSDLLIGSQNAPNAAGQPEFTAFQVWVAPAATQSHLITASAFRADNSPIGEANLTINIASLTVAPQSPATPLVSGPASTAAATALVTAPVTIVPTITPSNTPAQVVPSPAATTSANVPQVKVTNAFLNIRSGPGTNYQFIGALKQGDLVTIIGRNADRSWWVIQGDQVRGWIINNPSFIQVTGDTSNIPLAAAPPSPIPTQPQPTPLPPLVPTSTPRTG